MAGAQFDNDGRLRHLLTLRDMPAAVTQEIFDRADYFSRPRADRPLAGRLVANVFFETSTRTNTAFAAAAQMLGAQVVHLNQSTMAMKNKGESFADTLQTVFAMSPAVVVLRHGDSGAADFAARLAPDSIAVANGGDGAHAHPTQGLLDVYTLRRIFKGRFEGKTVALVGDILHSRVARSDAALLRALGANLRFVAPLGFCPPALARALDGERCGDIDEGLRGVDAVILLRIQRERMLDSFYPSFAAYRRDYCLTPARAARMKPGAPILHPGPMNRGVEIESELADGPRSAVLAQVKNGMAARMAALSMLVENR